MRLVKLLFPILLATSAWALPVGPITFTDELASQNPADVVGDPALFEIYHVTFSSTDPNTLQIDMRFNYGGGSSLGSFDTPFFPATLNIGDFFFRTASNTYAFILNGHDGLQTNGFYQVSGALDSRTVLGDPNDPDYRPDALVWANPAGAVSVGSGSTSVSTVGGPNELLATILITMNGDVAQKLDAFDFYFASATCGNDEISGNVPEPGTWAMIGLGLAGLGIFRRKR